MGRPHSSIFLSDGDTQLFSSISIAKVQSFRARETAICMTTKAIMRTKMIGPVMRTLVDPLDNHPEEIYGVYD